jgi:hypothetical protein
MNDPIKRALSQDPSCPRLESLAAALIHKENDKAHADATEHIAKCPRCRASYLLQADFENAVPTEDEAAVIEYVSSRMTNPAPSGLKAPVPIRAARRRTLWTPGFFTGIAAAALISAMALGVRDHNAKVSGSLGPKGVVYRSATLQTESPAGSLTQPPVEFRWSEFKGASHFVISVMEVDRTIVYHADVKGLSLRLPAEVRAMLKPGRTLLWNVKAVDEAGNVLQESKVESFRFQ